MNDLVRNNNFEGHIDDSSSPKGLCFFYEKDTPNSDHIVFFGESE